MNINLTKEDKELLDINRAEIKRHSDSIGAISEGTINYINRVWKERGGVQIGDKISNKRGDTGFVTSLRLETYGEKISVSMDSTYAPPNKEGKPSKLVRRIYWSEDWTKA